VSRNESKTVYYASIGPELTLYDIDVDGAALIKRSTVTLPANIQYVWPHPARRTLYAYRATAVRRLRAIHTVPTR